MINCQPHVLNRERLSHEPHLIAFQDEAGWPTCGIGAGVDVDTIRPDFGFKHWRMTVDDDLVQASFV